MASERAFESLLRGYEKSLHWVLDHSLLVLIVAIATVGLAIFLYVEVPKGFFPQQDTGRLNGSIIADQSISFQEMQRKIQRLAAIAKQDPAVDTVLIFTGGGGGTTTNTGRVFIALKPLEGAQGDGRSDRQSVAPETRRRAGCDALPAGGAGREDRRPAIRRSVPVHDPQRQLADAEPLGTDSARRR